MSQTNLQNLISSRYEAEGVLGHGGMGVVIKANDTKLKRPVAIKCLSDELFQVEEAVEIFLSEARSLAELSHPHLVQVYDIIEADDGVAMVQELIDGKTLEQELKKRGRLPQEEVASILAQIASVTGYLHSVNFIHRDFKPANLLIDETGFISLIDFGLARRLDILNSRGTRVRGTPAYMAPEQVRNRALSPATDIYQIGISMFELLTGRLPFEENGDIFALTHAHVSEAPPRVDSIDTNIIPTFAQLIDDCLIKDPEERIDNCRELVERLDPIHWELTGLTLEQAELIHDFEDVGKGKSSRRMTTGQFKSLKHNSDPNVLARSTGEQSPFTTQNEEIRQEIISQENLTELELRLVKLEEENARKLRRTMFIAVAVTLLVVGATTAVAATEATLEAAPSATPDAPANAPEPTTPKAPTPDDPPEGAPAVTEAPERDDEPPAPSLAPVKKATSPARKKTAPARKVATKRTARPTPAKATTSSEAPATKPPKKKKKAGSGLDSFQVVDKNDDDIDNELKSLSDDDF